MGMSISPSLGTELRRLLELLDGDLERRYASLGLEYRPRFTPIVRSIEKLGPAPIKAIAQHCGLTHSAASQTVAQMVRHGLLTLKPGSDSRERIAEPTETLIQMLPLLHVQWAATNRAAARLETELSAPLLQTVGEAIAALERRAFSERIGDEMPVATSAADAFK
jgi:DNA-binding MarR family transcriptional regulator